MCPSSRIIIIYFKLTITSRTIFSTSDISCINFELTLVLFVHQTRFTGNIKMPEFAFRVIGAQSSTFFPVFCSIAIRIDSLPLTPSVYLLTTCMIQLTIIRTGTSRSRKKHVIAINFANINKLCFYAPFMFKNTFIFDVTMALLIPPFLPHYGSVAIIFTAQGPNV